MIFTIVRNKFKVNAYPKIGIAKKVIFCYNITCNGALAKW